MNFTKMHGLGNDFVVIDGVRQQVRLSHEQIQRMADRHFGIGFDQLLLVEANSSSESDAEFVYRIFNADGSEVEHCGNGARCFAQFVREQGLTQSTDIPVDTKGGRLNLHVRDDGQITVAMGVPTFVPDSIPFVADMPETYLPLEYALSLQLNEQVVDVNIAALAIGNPHAVLLVDDINQAPVADYGPLIESHERFPNRVNAGFVAVRDRQHIDVRVYERGAGETLACGTGACAAMVAARRWGLVEDTVIANLRGGQLEIQWSVEGQQITMTGPATTVYTGVIDVDPH